MLSKSQLVHYSDAGAQVTVCPYAADTDAASPGCTLQDTAGLVARLCWMLWHSLNMRGY